MVDERVFDRQNLIELKANEAYSKALNTKRM